MYLYPMLRLLLLLGAFALTTPLPAQTDFSAWEGHYAGQMSIDNVGQPPQTVAVSFELLPLIADSLWSHKMTFQSERHGEITKDYRLRAAIRGDTVNFVLDEQNGIEMPQTLLNDCFYGMYTIMGMTYVATLRRLPDGVLLWDLFAAPVSAQKVSEIVLQDGEDPTEMIGLRPTLQQTVFLRKQEKN